MPKGFTLIETTIAIVIVIIGILGAYALIPRLVKMAAVSSNRFVAAQLAKEGAELVRNLRDNVFLTDDPNNWTTILIGPATGELRNCFGVVNSGKAESTGGCEMDYNDVIAPLTPAPMYAARRLALNSSNLYDYEGTGGFTKFKRRIIVNTAQPTSISGDLAGAGVTDMLDIMVEVTWNGMEAPLRVYEQLYKWRF